MKSKTHFVKNLSFNRHDQLNRYSNQGGKFNQWGFKSLKKISLTD